MTLRELLIPNKYGTTPIIDILGIGVISYNPKGYAELKGVFYESAMLDLDTKCEMYDNNYVNISSGRIDHLTALIRHVVPLTPENYLINSAIQPITDIRYIQDGVMRVTKLTPRILDNLHDDGSGWINVLGEPEAVTFYIEDILYRLDLQGELK